MKSTLEIKLVGPSVWQPVMDAVFEKLTPVMRQKASSILWTMHNRHIGITPQLAAGLAAMILQPHGSRYGTDAWEAVNDRLLKEVTGQQYSAGLVFSALPPYTVFRLAAPIAAEACARIGYSCLLCQDEVDSGINATNYVPYVSEVATEIKRMAESKDDYFRLFWADRAMTLSAYSIRAFLRERSTALPETDPTALALMLRLKSDVTKARPLSFHPQPMVQPLKHREISRVKEGGYSGVHMTRRLEDMGDILLSEFVNPPAVLADRLINNGYLALRRQPRREKLRDVLVVGMMPGEVKPKLSADFVKTCWLDFMSRMGMLLVQGGRVRSEFRWLEGDALGRVRSCNFLLQDLPPEFSEIPVEGELNPTFRREFLTALGWLPQYMNTRARFGPVNLSRQFPGPVETTLKTGLESARQWAYEVWKSQKENLLWSMHETNPEQRNFLTGGPRSGLDIQRFAFTHIMLFLPAGQRGKGEMSGAAHLGELYGGFGIGSATGRSLSVTWVPEKPVGQEPWAFDCREKRYSQLFSPQNQPKTQTSKQQTGRQIAGKLVSTWRDYLIKELRNG